MPSRDERVGDRVLVVDVVRCRRTRTGCPATRRRRRRAPARIATAPISIASRLPGTGRTGAIPTPTIATSITRLLPLSDRPERERHDLVAVVVGAERHQDQLHLHADVHRFEITVDQSSLDPHLLRQLHVAEQVRHERLVRHVDEVGLFRHEPLCGPRVERAATVEGFVSHVGRTTPCAAPLRRERHDSARAAAAPDELRFLALREEVGCDRHLFRAQDRIAQGLHPLGPLVNERSPFTA